MKTAECVTPRHPDKLCDRVSDAIVDACLTQDPMSRCAIETMGGHGIVTITGELTTKAYINMREIAQSIVGKNYGVQINVVEQSPEIAGGVDTGGAGDQGIMVGYACNDNDDMIPQELYLARSLCRYLYSFYPSDGKTQVTIDNDGTILSVVASFQNASGGDLFMRVNQWLEENKLPYIGKINIHANPAGDWAIGGFDADTGLTGRKLMVDNYGPQVPIGGGCFSGKDATKVDRSGAYMARKIAVGLLKQLKAKEVIVKLAYAIGKVEPVMLTAEVDGKMLNGDFIKDVKNVTPIGMIEFLNLREPQFSKTAEWGHFGNGFPWDK